MAPTNELFSTLLTFAFSAALVLTAFAAPSSLSDDASTSPTITTSSGAYRGGLNQSQGVEFFKGVRYGQPPIGNLRFAASVAASAPPDGGGEQVQDATNFGNACPQLVRTTLCSRCLDSVYARHNVLTSGFIIALGRRIYNLVRQPIARGGYCGGLLVS